MSRVKITLSEKEKELIEQEAKEAGMSTAKYIRKCLADRHLHFDPIRFPYRKEDLETEGTNLYVRIPKGLNDAIRREAKRRGMSKSNYIVFLLAAKGTPVEINVDLPSKQMYTERMSSLLNDVLSMLDEAVERGMIYTDEVEDIVAELKAAVKEFTRAANEQDRDFTKQIDALREEIFQQKPPSGNGQVHIVSAV